MQIQDIDDYYRPKNFPWLPIAIIVAALILGGAYIYTKIASAHPAVPENTTSAETVGGTPTSAVSVARSVVPGKPAASLPPATTPTKPAPSYPAYYTGSYVDPPNMISSAESTAIIADCKKLEGEDKLDQARDKYLSILERTGKSLRPQIEMEIARLGIELVTSPRPMKGKVDYLIQSGDSLSSITAKFNCPTLLIQKANNIKESARVRVGDRLFILDHPDFSVIVSKSQNTLTLLLGGKFFKKYSVGTGVHAKTPAGTFKIVDKIAEPPWWPGDGRPSIPFGDPANILGTRWLALAATGDTPNVRGYGIHGTWDDNSIGKQSSAGCVRMHNPEVEELFMLLPRGTPVSIVE